MSERIDDIDTEGDSADDDLSIIKYWLTSDNRRSRLNGQLAEMLQNIYWHYESDSPANPNRNSFSYCPVCKSKLENFEQDDIWFQGKKCGNGHEFYERGGRLNYTTDGKRTHLVCEMSDNVLSSLLEGWLKDNPLLAPQLYSQIRRVFEHYER